jgi:nicotinamidase-related amidase
MRANKNYDPRNEGAWMFTVKDTWGAEFVEDLTPKPGDFIVSKFRSSAFHGTDLDLQLRSNDIRTTMICGCTTEGCVESTVRDATFHDYHPVVITDCVGSDVPELHEASVRVMSAYRADMASSDQVMDIWNRLSLGEQKGG